MSNNIVQLNEEIIKGQIKELVRGSVEETLNELLEAEADKLTQAARYERNEARHRHRGLDTGDRHRGRFSVLANCVVYGIIFKGESYAKTSSPKK